MPHHQRIAMGRRGLAAAFLVALLAFAFTWIPAGAARAQVFTAAELPTAPAVPNLPQFSRPWSLNQLGCTQIGDDWCGWIDMLLVDLDGNGYDDLCGYYGFRRDASGAVRSPRIEFLCVLSESSYGGTRDRFSSTVIRVPAITQALSVTMPQTLTQKLNVVRKVHAVDIDLDGKADHLCVRMGDGINCVRFANGQFAATSTLMQASFSDAAGWNEAGYESTIGFPKLGGKRAVCGRGIAGVHCFRVNAARNVFDEQIEVAAAFADQYGWRSNPKYFKTIRYVDTNGDGHDDICARGSDGIVCALYNPTTQQFAAASVWTQQFRDAWGWGAEGFYDSLAFIDLNNDKRVDICGRGFDGMWCGVSDGSKFLYATAQAPAVPRINAKQNLGSPQPPLSPPAYAGLLPFAIDRELDGRGTLCEPRGFPFYALHPTAKVELHCAKSSMSAGIIHRSTFGTVTRRVGEIPWDGHHMEFHLARFQSQRPDWACWIDRGSGSSASTLSRSVWCARVGS